MLNLVKRYLTNQKLPLTYLQSSRNLSTSFALKRTSLFTSRSQKKEDLDAKTVMITNLPYNATANDLRNHIPEISTCEHVSVITDKVTGVPMGYGFATFLHKQHAQRFLERVKMIDVPMNGKIINFSPKTPGKGPKQNPRFPYEIFVDRLPKGIHLDEFRLKNEVFPECDGFLVVCDRVHGLSRGYGFMSFKTKEKFDDFKKSLDNGKKYVLNGVELRICTQKEMTAESYGSNKSFRNTLGIPVFELYVGNIPADFTELQIKEIDGLSSCIHVHIPKSRYNRDQKRTFAFLTFDDESKRDSCLGKEVYVRGRRLVFSKAVQASGRQFARDENT